MKNNIIILVLIFFGQITYAQEFSSFYSYVQNRSNINPAYTGDQDHIRAILNSRTQFTGVPNSPRNIVFNLDAPVFIDQGVGLKVINDSRGVFGVTRIDASYAHRFHLNEEISLKFGLSVGVLNRRINTSDVQQQSKFFSLEDPTLFNGANNYTRFVSGFGMLLDWKELEVGFSAPQIIENATELNQHMVGTISYDYEIEQGKWSVEPTVIYQNLPVTKNLIDVLVYTKWKQKVTATIGYGNNNKIKLGAGFNIKGFGASYLYEYSSGELTDLSPNTHEIMLNVAIKKQTKRFGASNAQKRLDQMITYISELISDEKKYSKDFIQQEIANIYQQLDIILEENTEKNAGKVADQLKEVEQQVNFLLKKYNI